MQLDWLKLVYIHYCKFIKYELNHSETDTVTRLSVVN